MRTPDLSNDASDLPLVDPAAGLVPDIDIVARCGSWMI
jgi:hypothetical protein